jgi:hypothetical protein
MTKNSLRIMFVVLAISMLALVGWVTLSTVVGYQGREAITNAQRQSCVRGMQSKIDTANSNYSLSLAIGDAKQATSNDTGAVAAFLRDLHPQRELTLALDDAKGVIPADAHLLSAPLRHLATFNCDKVWPSASLFG